MGSDPVSRPQSILKNPLLYSSAILVASLSVALVVISRWQERRNIVGRARPHSFATE